MDATLQAALNGSVITLFGAIRIDMAGIGDRTAPLCLLDGAGTLAIGGEVYTGADALFGTIDSIDSLAEQDGDEAPELSLTLNVPDASGAAQIASPAMQGREVRIMVGALDPVSGLTFGAPEVKFLGEIDVPTLTVSGEGRQLELKIVSAFERLFEVQDGVRAQDGWHQSIWPGERGLEYMSGTEKNLYWASQEASATTTLAQAMASARSRAASLSSRFA